MEERDILDALRNDPQATVRCGRCGKEWPDFAAMTEEMERDRERGTSHKASCVGCQEEDLSPAEEVAIRDNLRHHGRDIPKEPWEAEYRRTPEYWAVLADLVRRRVGRRD